MTLGQFRTYNSQGLSSQVGGDGWITGFERRVELLSGTVGAAGSVMRLHTGDGAYQDFTHTGGNTYQSTEGDGAHDTLTYAAGTKTWTYVEGSSRREETYADHANATLKGRLTRIRDLLGDATSPTSWDVLYDGAGRITQIRSKDTGAGATPDALVFSYDAAGRLAALSTRENGVVLGQVAYGYDSIGRLSSVLVDLTPRDGAGDLETWNATDAAANDGYLYRTVYSYADATSLRISQVRQGDGTLVSYGYDAEGRIISVTQGDHNANDADGVGQTLTYSYDTANRRTDVSDSSGRTWSYGYDTAGHLTDVQAPAVDGQRDTSQYSYDADGNLVQARTARGGVVLSQSDYRYDANGNLLWQWNLVDPANNASATAVQRTYTANNQLASETVFTGLDADGAGSASAPQGGATTHFLRDAQGRVRFTITAAGEVTETTYATAGTGIGQVASVRRYLADTYSGAFTNSDVEAWATVERRAQSGLTEYGYDLRGRLNQTRGFDQVDTTGAGVQSDGTETVDYVYDAQGLLREKIIVRYPSGREESGTTLTEVASYAYDGLGRLLAETVQERRRAGGVLVDEATLRTTTWSYQDSGSTLRTSIEGGVAGDGAANDLLRTEIRNAAGQLIAVTESVLDGSAPARTTQHFYDSTGQLRASEDANGGRTYFFYDAEGQLAGQVDATGTVTAFVRDALGRVITTTTYATQVPTSGWLVDGAVVPAALASVLPAATAEDRSSQVQYDALGRKLAEIDGEGGLTRYTYDGAGRLLEARATDAAGSAATARVLRYFYDAAGRERGRLDAAGYLTEFQYDAGGRLVRSIAYATATAIGDRAVGSLDDLRPQSTGSDAVTRSFHDGRGNLIGQLDAEGYFTEYVYDQARNQRGVVFYSIKLDDADPAASFSTLRQLVQAGGQTRSTVRSYNSLGQLSVEATSEGLVTRFSYDSQGRLVHTVSAVDTTEARHAVARYDAFGNLVAELNGEGSALYSDDMSDTDLQALYASYGIRHSYDALGRRIESIDAEGNRTWYFHDAVGRLTHTVYGMYSDAEGMSNAEAEIEETRYDAFGQARDTIRYTGRVLLSPPFGRDEAAAAIQVLQYIATYDSRQQFKYDRRGLVTERSTAEGYRSLMAYNAFGELVRQDDQVSATGWRVTESAYDQRGQRLSLTEDAQGLARITTAQYDAFGRATQTTDGRGTATLYSFDRMGRQVAVQQTVSGRQERAELAYDAWGRVVSQVDALGRVTTFVHDNENRSMTMTTPEGLVVVTQYNLHGQQVEIRRQDGSTRAFEYDAEGRLIAETSGTESEWESRVDYRETFEYDRRGLLLAKGLGGYETVYTYDARGRVLSRSEAGWVESWVDTDGDGFEDTRTYVRNVHPGTTYQYDGLGRQLLITDATGVQTALRYDLDGRMLESITDPEGLALHTVYSWDGLGQQLTVTEGAGTAQATITAYAYDGLGRRTSEVASVGTLDLTTRYLYDANDNVVASVDALQQTTRFVYDEANRLTLSVDARGTVTEYRYDAAGQRTSSRVYANPVSLPAIPVQVSVVQVRAQLVADDTRDRQSYLIHDRDGRQTLAIDGAGVVTLRTLDAGGNAIQVRTLVTPLTLDGGLRQQLLDGQVSDAQLRTLFSTDDSRDRIDSYLYDSVGRVVGHVDGKGYYTQTRYDESGRVISEQLGGTAMDVAVHADIVAGMVSGAMPPEYYFSEVERRDPLTEYVYDDGGRLAFKLLYVQSTAYEWGTQGANSVQITRIVYDAAGRISGEIAYGVSPQIYFPSRMALVSTSDQQSAAVQGVIGWLEDAAGMSIDEVPQRRTRYLMDSAGRQHFSVGPDGLAQEYLYDALGQLIETRTFGDRVEVRDWDEAELAAHLSGVENVRVTRQEYDAAGNVVARYDALQAVERFTYDGIGQVTSFTDKNQATWTYHYDAAGNRIVETSPQVAVSVADPAGNLSTSTRSVTTLIEYDAFGNVTRRIEDAGSPTARATEYVYDSRGLQILTRFPDAGIMGPDGQIHATGIRPAVEVTYDALGRAVAQKDVLGYYSFKTYDAAGRVQYDIDAEGQVTEYRYNGFGQQVRLTRYANAISLDGNAPPSSAQIAELIQPSSRMDRQLRTEYDIAGRKWQVVEVMTYIRDWDGEISLAYGRGTDYTYNIYGELISERSMAGSGVEGIYETDYDYVHSLYGTAETRYFYDDAGRQTHRIDAEGYVTAWEYNANGERIREIQYARAGDGAPPEENPGEEWPESRASTEFDPLFVGHNRVAEWDYDALGRKIAERRSLGNPEDGAFVESLTGYDASGRATSVTVLGEETRTYYDALGRVTAVRESERDLVNGNADIQLGSTTVNLQSTSLYRRASPYSTMAYDAFGNVVQVRRYADGAETGQGGVASARDQVISTLYDWQGRGVLERDAAGTLHARTYDAADHLLATRSRLDGNSGRWSLAVNEAVYDKVGRQIINKVYRELHQGEGGAVLQVVVDTASQVRYNAFGEIIAKDSNLDMGVDTSEFAVQYQYDEQGNMISSNAEGGVKRNYEYDRAGRAIKESHVVRDSNGNLVTVETTMEYDLRGNLVKQILPGNTDQPGDVSTVERTFDAWGNVLSMLDQRGGTTFYEYNQQNQVVREVKPTVRVLNSDGSVSNIAPETLWDYDALGRLAGTRDANGNWQRSAYDASGRQSYTETATGDRTHFAYDAFGQKRYTQNPLGYLTFLEYDQAGRVVAQGDFLRDSDGQTRAKAVRERYALDQNGNRLRVTDALGYVNTYDYDSRGLVIRSLTAAGVAMSYGYDLQGNKIRETNALSDPSLAADGVPVFNGGVVDTQFAAIGQTVSFSVPAAAFTTAEGEIPAISVRVEYWDSAARAFRTADGFSYDPQTRTLSGTGTQNGEYRITYTATSASGRTATASSVLHVVNATAYANYYAGAPAPATGLFNQRVTAGQPFSYQMAAGTFVDTQGQGISYSASVLVKISEYDYERRQEITYDEWVTIGSPGDTSGLSFDPATGTLSGTLSGVQRYEVQITATGANGRSSSLNMEVQGRTESGRRTVIDYERDDEGEVMNLDELTWVYDYFGRLIDHNDLSGADYDYEYDSETGQLLRENSQWTEQARQYSTPIDDYWYDRDWSQYGLDADQTNLDLPEPLLLNDPERSYSYFRSGALKELREGNNWFRYTYDAAGNRTSEEAYTYDADGQLLHVLTRVSYDAHGRITKVTQKDMVANHTQLELNYDYDAVGNRRRVLARTSFDANAPGLDISGITNPDFERGDIGWTMSEGWSVVSGGEQGSTQRAQFDFTGSSTLLNKQRVEVKPGETITASVRVDQGASSEGEAGAAVAIQWYDYAGNAIKLSLGNMVDSASNGNIYDSRVSMQVPPGAVFMSIGVHAFRTGGGDALYVDNFTWGSAPANGNLANSSGWTFGTGTSWTSESGGSIRFQRDEESKAVNNERIAVRAGSVVNARGNVQQGASSAGTAWGAVFLRFYDADGNVITDVLGNRVDSGSGGAWHSSYINAQVPEGAVSMSIGGVSGRSGGKAVWMDDFSWNYERGGELGDVGDYVDPDPSNPYNMAEPFKDYWYQYDAQNRVTVANGKMKDGQIVLGNADVSYALDYDEAGNAVRRRYLSGHIHVAETTQYDERGQRLNVFQSVPLDGTSGLVLKDSYRYDAVGRVIEQRTYFDNGSVRNGVNVSGWLKHAETFSYDADGRIQQQLILGRQLGWTAGAPTDGGAFQVTNLGALQNLASVNYGMGYDVAGRLRGYTYQYAQHEEGSGAAADDPKGYTHRYNYTYEARDSYLEARVTGASSNQNFRASSTFSTYDAWGRRVAVRENTPLASNLGTLDDRIRYFSYDATGNILRRREGTLENGLFTQDAAQKTQTQLYAYVGGQLVASGKRTGEVDVVGRLTAYQSNNAAGSSRTTVLAGETLRGIAQRAYGNANLWYVLAEANAINDDSGLTAGTTLVVPEVKVTANDATTFKPFSPQEAIGNTSPSLPYIEPPPKEHCNGIAMVLMVVVAVVAAVFTAGAALALIAPSLMVGGVMATGAAVLTGGIAVSTAAIGAVAAGAAVAGAAFAGGMAGSIASQAVGKAMGVVDSFSLRSAVGSGLTSMAGAGIAGAIGGGKSVAQLIEAGGMGYAKVAAMGAATAAAGYAGGKIAGVADTHFSWRAIAAGAVSSVVGGKINHSLGVSSQPFVSDGIVSDTFGGMVGGVVSLHTRRTFGINDDINYGAIAADAFGNALGSSLASKLDKYIPVPQRARNASMADGRSFSERYPFATAELGEHRSVLGDGSAEIRSTDHVTNLPAVQVGVSDAEWMAQGLTMDQIAQLRWAFASHAVAAQDRARGNEIDVSAFNDGASDIAPAPRYQEPQRPAYTNTLSAPVSRGVGDVLREAIDGYTLPIRSVIELNMAAQDFALLAIKQGMNSIRERSQQAVMNASSAPEAVVASGVYAVNSVTDELLSGTIDSLRIFTNGEERRKLLGGVGTLVTTNPLTTGALAWEHWASLTDEDRLAKGGAAIVSLPRGITGLADLASLRRAAGSKINGTTESGLLRKLGERGVRNEERLTPDQEAQVFQHINELGLDPNDFHISSRVSLYSDMLDAVMIGPDAFPGKVRTTKGVFETMTPRAVVAHEAGHMLTSRAGTAFEPGSLLDEVGASLAGRRLPGLNGVERFQLLRDAVERSRLEGRSLRDVMAEMERIRND
ncbi:putative Ig domain-containing protein [Stenotrophomonas rhizophila]|uniref:putative Ig domain-containing protein n=1 Tax=Stenotrophomonas rhizophila TaxID=216778 RepID=UPI0015C50814|nr:putative Ig domain-containing protein [Stenotrophomonas rhizophila]